MTTEGYGHDFNAFDAVTAPLLEKATAKFGKHAYRNWYPFKSPKGAWMAFHMTSYTDLRVVNLDTMEVVVDGDFYSHIVVGEDGKRDFRHPDTTYGSHTNTSIYVPAYSVVDYTNYKGEPDRYTINDIEFDAPSDADPGTALEVIRSVPIAFNAWTIWAADYEFYVDAIDLSAIDDGVLRKFDLGASRAGMCIPISATHVRNYVKPSAEYWVKIGNKDAGETNSRCEDVTFDAHILTEQHLGRLNEGGRFRDIYAKGDAGYSHAPLPWEVLRDRIAARKAPTPA